MVALIQKLPRFVNCNDLCCIAESTLNSLVVMGRIIEVMHVVRNYGAFLTDIAVGVSTSLGFTVQSATIAIAIISAIAITAAFTAVERAYNGIFMLLAVRLWWWLQAIAVWLATAVLWWSS